MTKRVKKGRFSQGQNRRPITVGLAWYTPESFTEMKLVADDADDLDDTYEDWLKNAKRLAQKLKDEGFLVAQVPIDIPEWVAWCQENGYNELNGTTRSKYVGEKVAGKIQTSPLDKFVSRRIKPSRNPIPFLDEQEVLFEAERDRSIPPLYPFDPKRNLIRIPKGVEDHLRQLAQNGEKIEAVKQITRLTGASLRVSKDYIDSLL